MSKLWVENVNNPAVYYQDTDPSLVLGGSYLDKSNDIVSWHTLGPNILDEKRTRDKLKPLIFTKILPNLSDWPGSLTVQEQSIAVERVFVPYPIRLLYVSEDVDKDNWRRLVVYTEGSDINGLVGRSRAFQEMRIAVGEYVRTEFWNLPTSDPAYDPNQSLTYSQQFFEDCYTLVSWYTAANSPKFKNWIDNTVGTAYEFAGFKETAYYDQTLRDTLLTIYNGDY